MCHACRPPRSAPHGPLASVPRIAGEVVASVEQTHQPAHCEGADGGQSRGLARDGEAAPRSYQFETTSCIGVDTGELERRTGMSTRSDILIRLVTALARDKLAGWVLLRRNPYPLVRHVATVHHLQTCPANRGQGIGSALMHELRKIARAELGRGTDASGSARRAGSRGVLWAARVAGDRSLAQCSSPQRQRHSRGDPHDPDAALIYEWSRGRLVACRGVMEMVDPPPTAPLQGA
jgi:GNAT superfamily N-acetyltransferase